jgi:putative hydrolase of the HAD superfamily
VSVGRFDAVVFDLFGTLVPEFPAVDFHESVRGMGERVGADPDAFEELWNRTAIARQTGEYAHVEANVRAMVGKLGLEIDEVHVAEALDVRASLYRKWFHPRPGALETLEEVKRRGYPVALISMCAPDTPALWRASALAGFVDVEVFSCEVGLRKPDAAIYLYATERLGVAPEGCLYCGDGSYGELRGAEAVGMAAYEIRDPDVLTAAQLRPEGEVWSGASVADLRELLELLPSGG